MTNNERVISNYKVMYISGHRDYPADPKFLKTHITLNVYENRLEFEPKDWFPGLTINFDTIQDVTLTKRDISGLDVLAVGILAVATKVLNNINIKYTDDNGNTLILIFEMISGGTIWGTAKKCKELLSYIPINQAPQINQTPQINEVSEQKPKNEKPTNNDFDSIIETIEKLSELKDKGILTEEEFKSKKEELLKKLS